jgi:hypothetical protein
MDGNTETRGNNDNNRTVIGRNRIESVNNRITVPTDVSTENTIISSGNVIEGVRRSNTIINNLSISGLNVNRPTGLARTLSEGQLLPPYSTSAVPPSTVNSEESVNP